MKECNTYPGLEALIRGDQSGRFSGDLGLVFSGYPRFGIGLPCSLQNSIPLSLARNSDDTSLDISTRAKICQAWELVNGARNLAL